MVVREIIFLFIGYNAVGGNRQAGGSRPSLVFSWKIPGIVSESNFGCLHSNLKCEEFSISRAQCSALKENPRQWKSLTLYES